MTKEEFATKWSAAEHRSENILWSFYFSVNFGMILVLIFATVFLCISPFLLMPAERKPFQFLALRIVGLCTLTLATIYSLEYFFSRRWLKESGMQCPACGHILNNHTGEYLRPHVPGLCTNCEGSGKCRQVTKTGLCDKCGHHIFDA